ncbi:DUF6318 family protein [Arthrobacter sp. I2-34]|uniref:DUF6318 family protein n=1 Tax=Arthrobacter hankyongi TaxID=2904801 RepID=A0ABS9L9L4_9MICC|nr:DUF6318 family protein [Arthrobacter hankyongi]MCG2623286.1 DUF6318 family protein [Arthrobacter hankyongi]
MTVPSARARISVVLAAACALALGACSGDAEGAGTPVPSASTPAAAPATATPSPTAVYKPASADGPAENVPVPKLPESAREKSVKGLKAFVKYWYALLNYAYESSNLGPLRDVTSTNCTRCEAVYDGLDRWASEKKWIVGGQVNVLQVSDNFVADTAGVYQSPVHIKMAGSELYGRGGKKVEDRSPSEMIDLFLATYGETGWVAHDVGVIEGP